MAAYATLESVCGRRTPAMAALQWQHIIFVMQAVQLDEEDLLYVPGEFSALS